MVCKRSTTLPIIPRGALLLSLDLWITKRSFLVRPHQCNAFAGPIRGANAGAIRDFVNDNATISARKIRGIIYRTIKSITYGIITGVDDCYMVKELKSRSHR